MIDGEKALVLQSVKVLLYERRRAMTTVTIRPKALSGRVTVPPSKSQTHRLLLCAALAQGKSEIGNVAFSEDIRATLRCMEALGAEWEETAPGQLRISGLEPGKWTGELPHMDCGESGSTLRFMIPVALAVAGGGVFTGRGRLMQRPQRPYFDLFDEKGIFYEQREDSLVVRGRLIPGEYRLPGDVSSQFFTGLLYALSLLDGPSVVVSTTELESSEYIDMTVDAMARAGVHVQQGGDKKSYIIKPVQYKPLSEKVEGDWSQAGFWYAAIALGNRVEPEGLNAFSIQGDMVVAAHFLRLNIPGDVTIDVSGCPDLVPPLAVMAAVRSGTTRLVNAARLRIKESDRLASVTATLNAMGACVEEGADSLTIYGQESLVGGVEVDCCNDHRIAMMAAVAATRCEYPVKLLGADCVKKSYPYFWEHYQELGGDLDVVVSG